MKNVCRIKFRDIDNGLRLGLVKNLAVFFEKSRETSVSNMQNVEKVVPKMLCSIVGIFQYLNLIKVLARKNILSRLDL